MRIISVTFCYTADKLEVRENHFKSGKSQGKIKWKLKNIVHPIQAIITSINIHNMN